MRGFVGGQIAAGNGGEDAERAKSGCRQQRKAEHRLGRIEVAAAEITAERRQCRTRDCRTCKQPEQTADGTDGDCLGDQQSLELATLDAGCAQPGKLRAPRQCGLRLQRNTRKPPVNSATSASTLRLTR